MADPESTQRLPSLWAAVKVIASIIGYSAVTGHDWAKRHEVDAVIRVGMLTAKRERIKAREREIK